MSFLSHKSGRQKHSFSFRGFLSGVYLILVVTVHFASVLMAVVVSVVLGFVLTFVAN